MPIFRFENGNFCGRYHRPVDTPLDRSTVWPYGAREPGPYVYSRFANPTCAAAEEALGALEGADGEHARLVPSGAAATTVALLALLDPGQTVALGEGIYYGTETLLREELGRLGIAHLLLRQ